MSPSINVSMDPLTAALNFATAFFNWLVTPAAQKLEMDLEPFTQQIVTLISSQLPPVKAK